MERRTLGRQLLRRLQLEPYLGPRVQDRMPVRQVNRRKENLKVDLAVCRPSVSFNKKKIETQT